MRKPKIGDIVHYSCGVNGEIYPAIVFKFYPHSPDKCCELFIFQARSDSRICNYSEKYSLGCWSWPKEEKKCEHDYQVMLNKGHYDYTKCFKCGDVKEEKPKECEHEYDGILKLFCGKCGHKNPDKCPIPGCNCHLRAENPTDKAEELIEELLSKIVYSIYKYEKVGISFCAVEMCREIESLIKEYKGIK